MAHLLPNQAEPVKDVKPTEHFERDQQAEPAESVEPAEHVEPTVSTEPDESETIKPNEVIEPDDFNPAQYEVVIVEGEEEEEGEYKPQPLDFSEPSDSSSSSDEDEDIECDDSELSAEERTKRRVAIAFGKELYADRKQLKKNMRARYSDADTLRHNLEAVDSHGPGVEAYTSAARNFRREVTLNLWKSALQASHAQFVEEWHVFNEQVSRIESFLLRLGLGTGDPEGLRDAYHNGEDVLTWQ